MTRVLLHVQTPIQVLKIDVEGYEWRVLREMLNTADLEATRNLAVEFHLAVSGFVSFGILRQMTLLENIAYVIFIEAVYQR